MSVDISVPSNIASQTNMDDPINSLSLPTEESAVQSDVEMLEGEDAGEDDAMLLDEDAYPQPQEQEQEQVSPMDEDVVADESEQLEDAPQQIEQTEDLEVKDADVEIGEAADIAVDEEVVEAVEPTYVGEIEQVIVEAPVVEEPIVEASVVEEPIDDASAEVAAAEESSVEPVADGTPEVVSVIDESIAEPVTALTEVAEVDAVEEVPVVEETEAAVEVPVVEETEAAIEEPAEPEPVESAAAQEAITETAVIVEQSDSESPEKAVEESVTVIYESTTDSAPQSYTEESEDAKTAKPNIEIIDDDNSAVVISSPSKSEPNNVVDVEEYEETRNVRINFPDICVILTHEDAHYLLCPSDNSDSIVSELEAQPILEDFASLSQPIDTLFAYLRDVFQDRLDQDGELVLDIPVLDLSVSEDNVYTHDVTPYDLVDLYSSLLVNDNETLAESQPLFLNLTVQPRFISRFNSIATLIRSGKGLKHLHGAAADVIEIPDEPVKPVVVQDGESATAEEVVSQLQQDAEVEFTEENGVVPEITESVQAVDAPVEPLSESAPEPVTEVPETVFETEQVPVATSDDGSAELAKISTKRSFSDINIDSVEDTAEPNGKRAKSEEAE
ncbi:hypothetical protein BZA70DRAFT_130506 [Myxozyma melibiosi]|uniref:Uncharacterized protein n=1 Tax=Myxozyma melibiosi TaxID=54550 RepID=A0ABR1F8W5_9ASCO